MSKSGCEWQRGLEEPSLATRNIVKKISTTTAAATPTQPPQLYIFHFLTFLSSNHKQQDWDKKIIKNKLFSLSRKKHNLLSSTPWCSCHHSIRNYKWALPKESNIPLYTIFLSPKNQRKPNDHHRHIVSQRIILSHHIILMTMYTKQKRKNRKHQKIKAPTKNV